MLRSRKPRCSNSDMGIANMETTLEDVFLTSGLEDFDFNLDNPLSDVEPQEDPSGGWALWRFWWVPDWIIRTVVSKIVAFKARSRRNNYKQE